MIANFLIRPYRQLYTIQEDLGPKLFTMRNKIYERIDYEWENQNGIIQASLFILKNKKKKKYPCVIFCHGNSGSRYQFQNRICGIDQVELLLGSKLCVLLFDFSGCGLSSGDYVTYGKKEKFDLQTVVQKLRQMEIISDIGLWGRSMGAATILQYLSIDKDIKCIVLDSAFYSLKKVIQKQIEIFGVPSQMFRDHVYNWIYQGCLDQAKFNIEDINMDNYKQHFNVPAFIVHGQSDTLVDVSQGQELYDNYTGKLEYIEADIQHNDQRGLNIYKQIKEFFIQNFQIECIKKDNNDFQSTNLYFEDQIQCDQMEVAGKILIKEESKIEVKKKKTAFQDQIQNHNKKLMNYSMNIKIKDEKIHHLIHRQVQKNKQQQEILLQKQLDEMHKDFMKKKQSQIKKSLVFFSK